MMYEDLRTDTWKQSISACYHLGNIQLAVSPSSETANLRMTTFDFVERKPQAGWSESLVPVVRDWNIVIVLVRWSVVDFVFQSNLHPLIEMDCQFVKFPC